ncbi:MAG: septal ring lytic transglycosylase RlpA family protein [Candidatus Magnetoovum sp. WYHC-5]|nr:septal ring lytic transglycosylase RlpA family protein [Candidatus Magnetoovum sp. WYHC-5]
MKFNRIILSVLVMLVFLVIISPVIARAKNLLVASWYGPGFNGKLSASGEKFDMYSMTAAHKLLPFGTMVRVTNIENGKSVKVKINDRGPYKKGRALDLSYKAAKEIDLIKDGFGKVKVELVIRDKFKTKYIDMIDVRHYPERITDILFEHKTSAEEVKDVLGAFYDGVDIENGTSGYKVVINKYKDNNEQLITANVKSTVAKKNTINAYAKNSINRSNDVVFLYRKAKTATK